MNDKDLICIDKWLWAARFFKTRSLAADAVTGGMIEINGERPKPSRGIRRGDRLTIHRGPFEWTIIVKDISRLRGAAAQAQRVYEETPESFCKRETLAAQMKFAQPPEFASSGRPTKKDRREMAQFTRRAR